jgi:hypothetical protein
MATSIDTLVLGASFGSLLGIKLAFAGHDVRLVGLPEEVEPINDLGLRVRMPIRGRRELMELDSRLAPGRLSAATAADVDPSAYDLIALVISEPQYGRPGLRDLLAAVAASRVPCVAVMNMAPPPFLARLPGLEVRNLEGCYTDPSVWRDFLPELVTLCSADPQAFRPQEDEPHILEVSLATNFKVAPFDSDEHTGLLRRIQEDVQAIRFPADDGEIELPVKLKVRDSVFAPFSKWPMLLAGNYRCVREKEVRSIRDAVHDDLDLAREVYEWVAGVCRALGAPAGEQVPFERYADAARSLTEPASAARALRAGATQIERVDRLIRAVAAQHGIRNPEVDRVVATVDGWLAANRAASA